MPTALDKRPDILRFGSDGWQARYDKGFTRDNVVRLAEALGTVWSEELPGGIVFVGFDTRFEADSSALEAAATLASFGLDVRVSETFCPTPSVCWACAHHKDVAGGLIISATELSCEYCGMIIRAANGGPVSRDFLQRVESATPLEPTDQRGTFTTTDIVTPYKSALLNQINVSVIKELRPSVVVDPMYGAATDLLADVLSAAGCVVHQMHQGPVRDFGGIHPQPADPWADECSSMVVSRHAQLGLLLDCDGDRAAVVDETGRLLSPHELIPLITRHLVQNRKQTGRVVSTLTCSATVSRQAAHLGLESASVPVGFARLYSEIEQGDVLLAAEEYGGICIPSHLLERDGLLVALLVVEMLAYTHKSLAQLVAEDEAELGRMCYSRRGVRLDAAATQAFRNILPGLNPENVAGKVPVSVSHADGLKLQFKDDSWVLIRPSRMDALVRVYSEASNETLRDQLLDAACQIVKDEI